MVRVLIGVVSFQLRACQGSVNPWSHFGLQVLAQVQAAGNVIFNLLVNIEH